MNLARRRAAPLLVALIYALIASVTFGQGADSVRSTGTLNVSVLTDKGEAVRGLSADNFVLKQGGTTLAVTYVASVAEPTLIGLLVDTSSSMGRRWRSELPKALAGFVEHSGKSNEFLLARFSTTVEAQALPTRNGENLRLALEEIQRSPGRGESNLFSSVSKVMQHLGSFSHRKKALVIFTDGRFTDSASAFPKLRGELRKAKVPVYFVYPTNEFEDSFIGDLEPREFMKDAVNIAGGSVFALEKPEELRDVFIKLARYIDDQYVIGFQWDPSRTKVGWRSIDVEASAPSRLGIKGGLRVVNPVGYYF